MLAAHSVLCVEQTPTVAILAQGTHWAVAATQAFLPAGSAFALLWSKAPDQALPRPGHQGTNGSGLRDRGAGGLLT